MCSGTRMINTLGSGFSFRVWGCDTNSLLGTKIKISHGKMFSLFPVLLFYNSLIPPEGSWREWHPDFDHIYLSPGMAAVHLGWRLPVVACHWDLPILALVPMASCLTSPLHPGKLRWQPGVIIWCSSLGCEQAIPNLTIDSLECVGKNYSNSACPHKLKPIGGNHERCQFSPHSANTER